MENSKNGTSHPSEQVKVEYNENGFVIGYVHQGCGGELKEAHKDDIGTQFFTCQKCGETTYKIKTDERKKFDETNRQLRQHGVTIDEVEEAQRIYEATQIHPLIDFHRELGLTIACFVTASENTLVFARGNVFNAETESVLRENALSHSLSIREVKGCKLNRNQNEILLRLSAQLIRNEQIEIPLKNKLFGKMLQKASYYYYNEDKRYHIALVCWTLGTYMFPMFDAYPILIFQGQRETGKSTAIYLLRALCWNPTNPECSLREADLFRTIESGRQTYLIDLEKIPKDARDVIDIFESGYERGGSVRRCDGLTLEPVDYGTYSPKAAATRQTVPFSAKGVEIITMKAPDLIYTKRRPRLKLDPEHQDITEQIFKVILLGEAWRPVLEAYNALEQTDKLNGRRFRLWQPLLAICKVFSPDDYEDLLELAEEDAGRTEVGDRTSEVEDVILSLFLPLSAKNCSKRLSQLTEEIKQEMPWVQTWHVVKSALKNLGIVKRTSKTSKGITYLIDLEKARNKAEQRGIKLEPEETETVIEEPKTEETTATTCWICRKALPIDLRNCTVEDGKQCHTQCANRYRAGRHEKTDMKENSTHQKPIKKLKRILQPAFTREQFEEECIKIGWDKMQAQSKFASLIAEGRIKEPNKGVFQWAR